MIRAKNLTGYLQELDIFKHFKMLMMTQAQLEAFHSIPPDRRILECDASGNFVHILKSERLFNVILNYVLMVKDMGKMEEVGFVVSELVSSRHDTSVIAHFSFAFKNNYQRLYSAAHNCASSRFRNMNSVTP